MIRKLMLMMFMVMLLVGTVSAWEWDNVYRYDENTKTAVIENALGLGSDLAELKLIWGDTQVGIGTDTHVGTFGFTPYDNYDISTFSEIIIKDLKTNKDYVGRNVNYKVKRIEEVKTPIYKYQCLDNKTNSSCEYVLTGYQDFEQIKWVDIKNPNFNFNAYEYYEVGIFVDTEEGDYGDWIPNLMGV